MVKILLSAISGLLLAASFPTIDLWFLAPVSIALFYNQLVGSNFVKRTLFSFIYGIFFFAPLLHWSSIFVGALPWLILAIGEALFLLLIATMRWEHSSLHYLRFAAFWVVIEFAREKLPFGGFGWGRIGFSQISSPLSFYLPLFGVTGLSFMTVLFALALSKKGKRKTVFIMIVIVVLLGFGIEKNMDQRINSRQSNKPIQIALIQGGVPKADLNFNAIPMAVFNNHYETTIRYFASADYFAKPANLIIWPENASDLDPFLNKSISEKISNLQSKSNANFLIGAVTDTKDGPENVAISYLKNGEIVKYVKRDLAPFGEYIPIRNIAEAITPLAKNVNDFHSGAEITIIKTAGAKFTPLICFELLDDQTTTQNLRDSNLLISMTNNATFGRSSEAAQQFLIARVRAYEMRKVAAVVSTTGFTGFISNKGGVMVKAKQFSSTSLSRTIRMNDFQTPIAKHRNYPDYAIIAIFLLTFLRRERG